MNKDLTVGKPESVLCKFCLPLFGVPIEAKNSPQGLFFIFCFRQVPKAAARCLSLTSYAICGVDFAELFVCVYLGNVVKGAFADGYLVLLRKIIKGDLVPITFFAAGEIVYLLDVL